MSEKEEKIVAEITADFKKRQEARRSVELNWRLNMNFVVGNQFAQIASKGDIEESGNDNNDENDVLNIKITTRKEDALDQAKIDNNQDYGGI